MANEDFGEALCECKNKCEYEEPRKILVRLCANVRIATSIRSQSSFDELLLQLGTALSEEAAVDVYGTKEGLGEAPCECKNLMLTLSSLAASPSCGMASGMKYGLPMCEYSTYREMGVGNYLLR